MKQFKKRTIALVLASVVTVVGAFGAENYKNSLMSLKFESSGSGAVNVTLHTKRDYTYNLTPIKKDANTYVLMLPETNSQMSAKPELSGDVESVDVRTMPYTNTNKGYTRITIKTAPQVMLSAKKAIYIPEKKTEPTGQKEIQTTSVTSNVQTAPIRNERPIEEIYQPTETIHSRTGVAQTNPVDIKKSVQQFQPTQNTQPSQATQQSLSSQEVKNDVQISTEPIEDDSKIMEVLLLVMGIVLVIITSAYIFINAKNKLNEVLGEQPDLEFDDEKSVKPKEKQKNVKQIKNTIKSLDKMYGKPTNISAEKLVFSQPKQIVPQEEDKNVVVDLDELFQEKTKAEFSIEEEEEEDALADFLSAFSFAEEFEEDSGFNEELYNKYINNNELKFTQEDVARINSLLNSEINDETLKNISNYAVTSPIEKKPSRTEILENFVTTYTVNQNISFDNDDIDALNKLISVEIGSDFITDLRTNPERVAEMEKEISKHREKPYKTSEILTLNVKNMLPDLSEALKKQGGKEIEPETKVEVVYFSEGYEVSTLLIDEELPDLSKEVNNKQAYKPQPSAKIEYIASGYEVDQMVIKDELPDLADVIKNPEKYETKESEPIVADEETLLKNVSNVTFKPFDDGDDNFEIINKFDEVPNVSDIQEEFNKLGNLEIVNELDVNETEIISDNKFETRTDKATDDLLRLIEKKQETKKSKPVIEKVEKATQVTQKNVEAKMSCIVEGEEYTIVDTTQFAENNGCHLAKNESGYVVLGFVGERVFKIKHYEKLKSEKIQSRVSEKLENDSLRYIIRIGIHKFILNVSADDMEYVMDLC